MKYNCKFFLPVIAIIILTTIILLYIFVGIIPQSWDMSRPFVDLIGITSAVDCVRAGMDPYVHNMFDIWQRPFNYPKIWIVIFNLFNIERGSTNLFGLILSYTFINSTCFIFKISQWKELLLALLIIFSPIVLLLLERGNSDIIIYLLILFAVFYLRKIKSRNELLIIHLSYILILFAVFLKIYPIFLLLLLLFEKLSKRNMIIILTYSVIIFIGYCVFTYEDLLYISMNTPRPNYLAYGKNVALQLFLKGKSLAIVSNALMILIFGIALFINIRFKKQLNTLMPATINAKENILLFITGALIYSGTFLIGNNWDYRNTFLLLTIPLLIDIGRKMKINTINILN